jgi:hypothetical protein
MYHLEGTGLRNKAFIPPRVPVHDFHSGKEPPTSEWQPERYPFENDTEFLEIEEDDIVPEPERKVQKADDTAEVPAETELDEKEETVYVVKDDSIDSSQLIIRAGNWCEKVQEGIKLAQQLAQVTEAVDEEVKVDLQDVDGPQLRKGPPCVPHPAHSYTWNVYETRERLEPVGERKPRSYDLFVDQVHNPIVRTTLLDWLSKTAWYVPQEIQNIKWSHQDGREWSKGVTKLRPQDTTEVDEDRLPEELLEEAVSQLPGRPAEQIQPGNDQAQWTSQLSIGVYNLGNMTRKPHVPNLSKGARSRLNPEDLRYNLLIEFINKSATHIVALCEANGLQLPAAE